MIKPTVGRIVWYRPSEFDRTQMTVHDQGHPSEQPLAATVAYVWSDTLVNLTVSDHNGATHQRTSVFLDQGEGHGGYNAWCEWMPYQKGQAAKTEMLEKRIDPGAAA
jgi:hypothetical protein